MQKHFIYKEKIMLNQKYEKLLRVLEGHKSLIVAFSGGVDSSLLLFAAKQALGQGVVAVTSDSPIHHSQEIEAAGQIAKSLDVEHIVITTNELENPEFFANSKERCYVCKKGLFALLKQIAQERDFAFVAHGENVDDTDDYRPGALAAKEAGVKAPLIEAGLSKVEIRELARVHGLASWNMPSNACLATRIPAGVAITSDALRKIDLAETALAQEGFGALRVRFHGDVARIEVMPENFGRVMDREVQNRIIKKIKDAGFKFAALDLEGYRSGNMNDETEGKA